MISNVTSIATTLILLAVTLGSSACSGGGGGGGGGGAPTAVRVEATGQPTPLWQGSPIAPPLCAATIGPHAEITFTFAGPVDSLSIPQGGFADGSIDIRTTSDVPAAGTFRVQDDPSFPAGNERQVVFTPTLPLTPGQVGTSGLMGPETYIVQVRGGASQGPHVTSNGVPLTNEILTCFATCDPASGGCLSDPVPGPAFVESTIPATSDPAPEPIHPASVTVFTATISEALNPSNVDITTVRLVNVASGAQVPGSVTFRQQGTIPAAAGGAVIEYLPSQALPFGVTYELEIDPSIIDLGGNPLAVTDPTGGSARRLFRTAAMAACPQAPHVEDFTTTQNIGSLSANARWTGNGEATIRLIEDAFGSGGFGPLIFAGAGLATMDTGMAAEPGFSDGVWEVTDFQVAAGAQVRVIGSFGAWVKCTGTATVNGLLDGRAGTSSSVPLGHPNQGPGSGLFNNGGLSGLITVLGGVAGVGGGDGGRASQDGLMRTLRGESGFGATVAGVVNAGPFGGNPLFGGGQGGEGGFRFPSGGVAGDLGGNGGAGGSAWAGGEHGQPHTSPSAQCQPSGQGNQSISAATGIPASFIAPVSEQSAGSGGGGGGDRFETTGPASDDQGGGGGGGGGGIRVSALAGIDVGPAAQLLCDGARGGLGNLFFGGGGGGGSGGEVWLQTPSDLTISSSATISVNGGSAINTCSDHASGAGGAGLIQLEDEDGVINTNFLGTAPTGGANVISVPLDSGPFVTATATSEFFDAAHFAPTYDPSLISEVSSLGDIPGATVLVQYQGAHEAVSGGGIPDLATLSGAVPGSLINTLNGYRFVRFTITLQYPSLPLPPPTAVAPSVQQVSIGYSIAIPCF